MKPISTTCCKRFDNSCYHLQCSDYNWSYRNVRNVPLISFALAVIFISSVLFLTIFVIKLCWKGVSWLTKIWLIEALKLYGTTELAPSLQCWNRPEKSIPVLPTTFAQFIRIGSKAATHGNSQDNVAIEENMRLFQKKTTKWKSKTTTKKQNDLQQTTTKCSTNNNISTSFLRRCAPSAKHHHSAGNDDWQNSYSGDGKNKYQDPWSCRDDAWRSHEKISYNVAKQLTSSEHTTYTTRRENKCLHQSPRRLTLP